MKYDAMKEAIDMEKTRKESLEKNNKEMEKMIFKLKSEMESIKTNYDGQVKLKEKFFLDKFLDQNAVRTYHFLDFQW